MATITTVTTTTTTTTIRTVTTATTRTTVTATIKTTLCQYRRITTRTKTQLYQQQANQHVTTATKINQTQPTTPTNNKQQH